MHTDINNLVPRYKFILTPDYDNTVADEARKKDSIVASAKKKARNLISQMQGAAAPTSKQLLGRLSLDRVRSDELDTFMEAFKAEVESELSTHLVVVVPYENVQSRVPVRDLTVYAWPRLVAASAVAS